jgi:acetyl-CoA synthase
MTSCGCFESIIAIFPEANGIMVTTREHKGMTPCGMTFSTLAGQVGGGLQTPGFMGVGRTYILSKRFIVADGGLARVAWMPKELKSYLIDRGFRERCEQAGLGADFIDKIADESAGTTPEEVVAFLSEKGHPCLSLPSII